MSNPRIAVINVFTPKPGCLDEFVAVQQSGLPVLRSQVQGVRGSRLYRALDGQTVTLISVFDSKEDFERVQRSEAFATHREKLVPLLDKTAPVLHELVYEWGVI
jgi:heme-degrading monooxygenase HmoA